MDIACHRNAGSILIEGENPGSYPILLNGVDYGDITGTVIEGLDAGK